MTAVTVTLQPHHVRALVDARIKLTLLHQLGVDFSLICEALDEVVQMCSENRERVPRERRDTTENTAEAINYRPPLTIADLRKRGVDPEPHSVHWTRTQR